jgi:hypothetical protein
MSMGIETSYFDDMVEEDKFCLFMRYNWRKQFERNVNFDEFCSIMDRCFCVYAKNLEFFLYFEVYTNDFDELLFHIIYDKRVIRKYLLDFNNLFTYIEYVFPFFKRFEGLTKDKVTAKIAKRYGFTVNYDTESKKYKVTRRFNNGNAKIQTTDSSCSSEATTTSKKASDIN